MADVKISALPAATTPLAGTEVLPIVQSSTTKQVSIANVTAGRAISASSLTLTTPLGVASGGTGLTSLTAGYIPYGNGTGAFSNSANLTYSGSQLSVTTSGNGNAFVTSNGSTSAAIFTGGGSITFGDAAGNNLALIVPGSNYYTIYTNGSEKARIDSSGNLLVGTTSNDNTVNTGGRLYANGAIASTRSETANTATTFAVYSTGATANRFYVGMGGTVYATSTTISAISDRRFKENIVDLDVGLDALLSLKPRKFDWKAGKGKDIKGDRGWIADEFQQVFPDLIDTWKDAPPEGEEPYKSVRPDLMPVVVRAIQELAANEQELRSRLSALEARQ